MAVTLEQLETVVKQLEAETRQLREQVAENAFAKDYVQIWKLMSTYSHLYYLGRYSEVPGLFAQKTEGVTMEIEDSGVYEGVGSIKRFWTEVFDVERMQRTPGWLAVHMTVNPVIEINKKGTEARGIWHSHGFVSMVRDDGYLQALCMGKYIVDYIKEDGQWKFYHFSYRIAFMCPYEKGWVEQPITAAIGDNPANRPDKPTTYHVPYSRYRINAFEPGPFEPYDG
jgi:hypothetical protein